MEIKPKKWMLLGCAAAAPLWGFADVLAAWDVDGVDVAAGAGVDDAAYPYAMDATTRGVNISGGGLTLGFDAPSDATGMYGFKFAAATHQTSLANAVASNHYIQFTIVAGMGYRFDLLSIEMNGQSGTSGPDNIALLSDIDGFVAGNELATLSGRQGITGGWDTDPSGWDGLIGLSDAKYQNLAVATFRIYGWNSTGTASAGIRNLSGNDLVINGTVKAIPEPAAVAFIALGGTGLFMANRFFFKA